MHPKYWIIVEPFIIERSKIWFGFTILGLAGYGGSWIECHRYIDPKTDSGCSVTQFYWSLDKVTVLRGYLNQTFFSLMMQCQIIIYKEFCAVRHSPIVHKLSYS